MSETKCRNWNRREFLSALGAGAIGTSFLGGLGALTPSVARATEGSRFSGLQKAVSEGGAIASISPYATAIGIEVLKAGGNAVDAAVATVFALGVTRPEMGGIGGCGMLLYVGRRGEAAALDFQGAASAGFPADALLGPGMHNDPTVFFGMENSGHRVVGLPGVVAGLSAALDRYGSGRFPLADLISPAEVLAREGFEISDELALFIFLEKERLNYYKETAEVYLAWDVPAYRWPELKPVIGTGVPVQRVKLVQTDYARSLRRIMEGGRDAFYRGWIAEQIADDMAKAEFNSQLNPVLQAHGPAKWGGASHDKGYFTYDDLASYQAIWREPLVGHYRGNEIITMPPCGSGVAVLEILNILQRFDLADFGHSSADHLHVLAEAQKIAYADREALIADPNVHPEVNANADTLSSEDYGNWRHNQIDIDHAQRYEGGPVYHGGHTNHASVIDREGNAVAVTTTQGFPFGSVVMAPGTGFVLNDQLGDWIGRGGLDQPHPGARPRTNMSPTVVLHGGQPILVTGAAGGSRIPIGILQQILNVVDFEMGLDRAIDAERMDAANFSSALAIESGGNRPLNPEVKQDLTSRGHKVQELAEYDGRPNVQSVGIDFETGLRVAVCDPRGEGGAGGE